MDQYQLVALPNGNDNELEEFEKSLFQAFNSQNMESVWDLDKKAKRFTPKVGYNNQTIFTIKCKALNKYIAGIGINYDTANKLQVEIEGFHIKKDNRNICEILYLFSLSEFTFGSDTLIPLISKNAMDHMLSNKVDWIYASCSQRRASVYKHLGFNVLEEKVIERDRIALLEFKTTIKIVSDNFIKTKKCSPSILSAGWRT